MAEQHNKAAGELWDQGGADYDAVSYAISDALAHAAQRLWAKPGEAYLAHRLSLHGIAPWGESATASSGGRMISQPP